MAPTLPPAGDLRAALYKEVDGFVAALHGRDFMGGSSPNLADLSAYGVLKAVQGTPTYNDVVLNTKVGGWGMGVAPVCCAAPLRSVGNGGRVRGCGGGT